jgi:hypothetical protein
MSIVAFANAAGRKQKRWLPVSHRSAFSGDCPAAGRMLAGCESMAQIRG